MRVVGLAGLSLALSVMVLTPAPAEAEPTSCGVAAHRGDHSVRTENSLGAMRQAITDHVDYLELDVRTSRQGTLFLMHDRLVDRTTDGSGAIRRMTDAQVRALRLDDGERVPTLAHVFRAAASSDVNVLVELKEVSDSAFRPLVREVRSFGRPRVRVVSFHTDLLDRLSAMAPGIREGIISRRALSPAEVAPYDSIVVKYAAVTDGWLSSMTHPVFVWTVDTPEEWNSVAGKVRAVITNQPVAAGGGKSGFASPG